jgi:hypothetical protein
VSQLIGMDIEEYLEADRQATVALMLAVADAEARRGFKAIMLAPTLDLCQVLLRGERVPWRMLRPDQAERFGLKHARPDGRLALDDFNEVRK